MTTVYDNFTDPVTGAVPAGRVEYRNVIDRDNTVPGSSSVGTKTVAAKTIKAVLASDGSVSTVLEPGPYLVRSVFDGSDVRTWRDIIVPASGSYRLQVLKDSFTQAPSTPAAVAALLALLDARFPSQSAIDAQLAALKALIVGPNAPATLDTIAEIATALGNDPQLVSNLVTAVAGKYSKPSSGIPLSDLKKSDLDGAYGRVWQPSTVYDTTTPIILPNGQIGKRTTAGTSGTSFDATELAAWTISAGGSAPGSGLTVTDNGSTLTLDVASGGSTTLTDNGSTVTIAA